MTQQTTIQIPAHLKAYIKHVWLLDGNSNANDARSFSIFADGCPGIIFHQSSSGLFLNQQKKLSPVFLYGQTINPIQLNINEGAAMLVLNFYPHVVHELFRFSAKEVTDDCLDLRLLPSVPRINLTEQLWNTVSTERQLQLLFDYLHCLIEKNKTTTDKGIQFATSHIANAGGEVSLKELHRILNVTERTFERKFEQHVGISPKMFSKIAQFQASLVQMKNKKFFKLSDIAYDNGYADQSHFIRNFKKFTGLSPFEFQKQSHKIYEDFPALIA